MAKLVLNNNKAQGPFTQKITSPSLVYYDSGEKHYYPLIKPNDSFRYSGFIYSYDKSVGDILVIVLNNTKYVVPNKRVPSPGHKPSAFKKLVT